MIAVIIGLSFIAGVSVGVAVTVCFFQSVPSTTNNNPDPDPGERKAA